MLSQWMCMNLEMTLSNKLPLLSTKGQERNSYLSFPFLLHSGGEIRTISHCFSGTENTT